MSVVTAIGVSLPPRTSGSTDGTDMIATSTEPTIRSLSPGAAPLYGTCSSLIAAAFFNCSPYR